MVPRSPHDVLSPPGRQPAPGVWSLAALALPPGAVLVLARHGRTAWNAEGRYQGQADPPLDEVGEAQAIALASDLVGWRRPTVVVSSDLLRARQTAGAIASLAGVAPRLDPRLREVDLGAWEGLDRQEAAVRYPAEYQAWTAGRKAGAADAWELRRGGSETAAEAGVRAAGALIEVATCLAPGETAVILSHGLVLQAALRQLGVVDPPHLGNGRYLNVEGAPIEV